MDITSIQLGISEVKFQSNVNDLGVIIDDILLMKDHVQRICRSSYYQLRQLRYVSHSRWNHVKLSSTRLCPADSTTVTVCFTVSTNINSTCCSAVLRASARLIFRKRKFDSISLEIRDIMQLVANFQGDRIEFPLTENQASRGTKDRRKPMPLAPCEEEDRIQDLYNGLQMSTRRSSTLPR